MGMPAGQPLHGAASRVALRYGRVGLLVCSLLLTVSAAVAAQTLPTPGRHESTALGADRAGVVPTDPSDGSGGGAGAGSLDDFGTTAREAADTRGGHAGRVEERPDPTPPAASGHGRRVVFDMSAQRVWLIGRDGHAATSYLVSGSLTDNLAPGRYEVYSRSRHATSFDLQSTMGYMVRFGYGQRAAIGFHDIPVDLTGDPLQELSELGSPQSHGCIRQRRADARQMWDFAVLGTPVVVVP